MRHVTIGLLLSFLLSTSLAADRTPKIGSTIGELRFKDIRSVQRSLADFGKKRAYVFVFTTTQCPLVGRTLPKLMELDSRFGPQEVQFVAVNVGAEDSIRDMAAQALEFDVSFPFVKVVIFQSGRRPEDGAPPAKMTCSDIFFGPGRFRIGAIPFLRPGPF